MTELTTADPANLDIGDEVTFECAVNGVVTGTVIEKNEVFNEDLEGYVQGATVEPEADDTPPMVRYSGHESVIDGELHYNSERVVTEEPVLEDSE